jgi:hypothetical protein
VLGRANPLADKYPTMESIEAAIRRQNCGDPAETHQWNQVFASLYSQSQLLQTAVHAMAAALAAKDPAGFTTAEFRKLRRTGGIDDDFLSTVLAVCSTFFGIGWAAREATGGSEQNPSNPNHPATAEGVPILRTEKMPS